MDWKKVWRSIVVAACVVMLAGAPLPQIDSVTAHYAKIAKHVLESGEWITLRHPNRPGWIQDKPPLTIWLLAFSIRLLGGSDVALRLWHLLMTLALVIVTYLIARLALDEEASLLAALLVVTFAAVFYLSGMPQQDVPLALFLALAFYAYLIYRRDGRIRHAVLSACWLALAVLSKGLIAPAVFGPVVGAELLLARRRGEPGCWRWGHAAVAGVVFLAVALPWFVVGALRQGMPFVETFTTGDNGLARFLRPFLGERVGPRLPHGFSPLAYLALLMIGMLPWTGLLPGAATVAAHSLGRGPAPLRLCGLWGGFVFLMFALSSGDRVLRYLLPAFPALAVLGGQSLASMVDEPRRLRATAVMSGALGIPLWAGLIWITGLENVPLLKAYLRLAAPSLATMALALVAFGAITFRGHSREAVAMLAIGAVLSYAAAYGAMATGYRRLWPWPEVAGAVNRLSREGDRVLVMGSAGAEVDFAAYGITIPVLPARSDHEFLVAWQSGPLFGLLSPDAYARLGTQVDGTVLVRMPTGWVLITNRYCCR
ncbi:MAG: glycosyltransferase family 39 protein [Armatimonadota bacterium]|nr:glycosyltransferase family 39 protein [Armatimonadota bacterium]